MEAPEQLPFTRQVLRMLLQMLSRNRWRIGTVAKMQPEMVLTCHSLTSSGQQKPTHTPTQPQPWKFAEKSSRQNGD